MQVSLKTTSGSVVASTSVDFEHAACAPQQSKPHSLCDTFVTRQLQPRTVLDWAQGQFHPDECDYPGLPVEYFGVVQYGLVWRGLAGRWERRVPRSTTVGNGVPPSC